MGESEHAPLIRLSVDQEVFIETIEDGDKVEDATVATEVTSFDRVGDAYVLEGAIVFAGYLTRMNSGDDHLDAASTDAVSMEFDSGQFAEHVHHRMPFVLRVPTDHQPRGIVNVASRIASWNLDVIGAGWLRVVADLNIVGLNGNHGFHFQCGAQEEGDLFFEDELAAQRNQSETTEMTETGLAAEMIEHASGTMDFQWMRSLNRGEDDGNPSETDADVSTSSLVKDQVENLSEARGGLSESDNFSDSVEMQVETAEASILRSQLSADAGAGSEERSEAPELGSAAESLRNFDRAMNGAPKGQVPVGDDTAADLAQSSDMQSSAHDFVEFEFEHQVGVGELAHAEPESSTPAEEFVASRGFSSEGFRAADGFVPSINVSSKSADETETTNDVRSEKAEFEPSQPPPVAHVDTSLWSFVDFNAPEQKYTLRYAIVMEEETLEMVSERLSCSTAEIIRVNHLKEDVVYAGQMLLVPGTVAVSHRS